MQKPTLYMQIIKHPTGEMLPYDKHSCVRRSQVITYFTGIYRCSILDPKRILREFL